MPYEIIEGVRRAKAARLAGHHQIRAKVYDASGAVLLEVRDISLDDLYCPSKSVIERITPRQERRWQDVWRAASRQPPIFPPIAVRAGSRGVPLDQVGFDFRGVP